jgi:SAM-dependent methyltransferase
VGRVGRVGQVGLVGVMALAPACGTAPAPPDSPGRAPAAASAPATQPPGSRRLFPPQDLGLLEAPDRDEWQKPDLIMDTLGIAEGSVVADIGAGGGWFTIRMARRVGPNGLVYAEDIQPLMIEATNRRVAREDLRNVRTVLGTPSDPALPPGVDVELMVDTFHEMDDPVPLLRNLAHALKPGGRLGIVEFTAGGGGPGPDPESRVEPDTVVAAASAAGFSLTSREALPPFLYLLVFTPGAAGS